MSDRISSSGRLVPAITYPIYPVIRPGFSLSRMASNKSVLRNFAIIQDLHFLTIPKAYIVDLSYKMDLDFWDSFGRKNVCLITKEIQ